MQSKEAATHRHVLGLDIIRFAAASTVMAFHLCAATELASATSWGWVGVEVFFVLSGYVIAYSAEGATADRFLRNRIVRLFPAAWVCSSATALYWLASGGLPDLGGRFLRSVILWPIGPWIDGVYWTLPVEIVFYGAIFLVLAAGLFRRVEALFIGLGLISSAYWLARLLDQRLGAFAWIEAVPPTMVGLALAQGCYFALGGTLWVCERQGATIARLAFMAVCFGAGLLQIAFYGRALSATTWLGAPMLVWAASVLSIVAAVRWKGAIATILNPNAALIRLAGLSTYPLYLLHDDMGSGLRQVLAGVIGARPAIAVTAALLIALALLVTAFVEPTIQRPLRAMLAYLLARHPRSGVDDGTLRGSSARDG
jgi:peptidoglycan/LPS O-acetylase OafA/YrhL